MRHAALDGNAALFFFGHVVHGGKAFFHLARPANLARRKKNTLRKSRLSGVYVGKDCNVANRLRHDTTNLKILV